MAVRHCRNSVGAGSGASTLVVSGGNTPTGNVAPQTMAATGGTLVQSTMPSASVVAVRTMSVPRQW
jgi:hypothetical protein